MDHKSYHKSSNTIWYWGLSCRNSMLEDFEKRLMTILKQKNDKNIYQIINHKNTSKHHKNRSYHHKTHHKSYHKSQTFPFLIAARRSESTCASSQSTAKLVPDTFAWKMRLILWYFLWCHTCFVMCFVWYMMEFVMRYLFYDVFYDPYDVFVMCFYDIYDVVMILWYDICDVFYDVPRLSSQYSRPSSPKMWSASDPELDTRYEEAYYPIDPH